MRLPSGVGSVSHSPRYGTWCQQHATIRLAKAGQGGDVVDTDDDGGVATAEPALDAEDTEELLVEEISIDGICGVY